jgi:hypothetical protein
MMQGQGVQGQGMPPFQGAQQGPRAGGEAGPPEGAGGGPEMRSVLGQGMRGRTMANIMIVLLDTDEDGGLSLEEVQAVHSRMFNYLDGDDDGRLTAEEIASFWGPGAAGAGP